MPRRSTTLYEKTSSTEKTNAISTDSKYVYGHINFCYYPFVFCLLFFQNPLKNIFIIVTITTTATNTKQKNTTKLLLHTPPPPLLVLLLFYIVFYYFLFCTSLSSSHNHLNVLALTHLKKKKNRSFLTQLGNKVNT